MIEIQTKKQHKENVKELINFCREDENHCLMWNYMLTIKKIREEPEDKLLMEKLKKQATDYQYKLKKGKWRKKQQNRTL